MNTRFLSISGMILIFCLCSAVIATAVQSPKVISLSDQKLTDAVAKLDLGFEQYRLGETLTKAQLEVAKTNPIKDNYQGTINFKDGKIGIVADVGNKSILALYLTEEKADQEKIKNMLGTLMATFGQPTTMAHNKIVYWAFNEQGLIPEEIHQKARKIDELNIIATVKFSSKTRFMEKQEENETNSIYCIVSSPALLERFMKK